ncbi:MAG: OmpA family protein [Tunicatimonas sp.]
MLIRNVFLLLFSVALVGNVAAQRSAAYSTKSKKAIESYEKSTNFFIRRQYGPALELLAYAIKKDGDFAEAHLRMGKIYYALKDPSKAKGHLKKAVKEQYDNPRFTDGHLLLANLYFGDGEFDAARQLINDLLKLPRLPKVIADDARHLLANVAFTEREIGNPLPYQPEAVAGVNRLGMQYFPVLTVDQQTMIFTGRRGSSPQYDEDIYVSERDDEGRWQEPQLLSENITTPRNEGTCTVSADGRTLIFTACEDRRGRGSCDLYITRRTGDRWSRAESLGPGVNGRSWDSQPSLSADGRTLYFVSDRPGGQGLRDIYVSEWQDSTWGPAQNVGPTINTPRDEVSPFIHVNGETLYFSSNGRPGFGGFDLYVTEQDGDGLSSPGWEAPRNLGYPINNSMDQASLFITADGRYGYYNNEQNENNRSVRSEIYRFELPEAVRVTHRSSYVRGTVYDAQTKKPLAATVALVDRTQDRRLSRVTSDSVTGGYLMVLTEGADYALYVDKSNYLFKSMAFDYAGTGSQDKLEPVTLDVYLEPIEKGRETVLSNIFFDTDKYVIKPASEPELQKVVAFLMENPAIRVAINGHTDNVGTTAHNEALSTNRAQAVHDYLKTHGVSAERLTYRGYGAQRPIAENDTAAGRQKNRRITFEIL